MKLVCLSLIFYRTGGGGHASLRVKQKISMRCIDQDEHGYRKWNHDVKARRVKLNLFRWGKNRVSNRLRARPTFCFWVTTRGFVGKFKICVFATVRGVDGTLFSFVLAFISFLILINAVAIPLHGVKATVWNTEFPVKTHISSLIGKLTETDAGDGTQTIKRSGGTFGRFLNTDWYDFTYVFKGL